VRVLPYKLTCMLVRVKELEPHHGLLCNSGIEERSARIHHLHSGKMKEGEVGEC
jgi:hypothetical protein